MPPKKKTDDDYDDAPEVAPAPTSPDTPVVMGTSSDASKSSYSEVKPDPDEMPPPGGQVQQERGTP